MNRAEANFRNGIIERLLIRGKGVREISRVLLKEYNIRCSAMAVSRVKTQLDKDIIKSREQFIDSLPVEQERLRRRVNELSDMTFKVHDSTQNKEIQLKSISLL